MDKNDNVLVLAHNIEKYLPNTNGKIEEIYRYKLKNKLLRAIRKISMSFSFLNSLWLDDWYKNIKNYFKIIIFDTGNADCLINIIKKRNPDADIILWYWNPIEKSIPLTKIDKSKCEIWSYNVQNCKKYNLKSNTQFYIENNIKYEGYHIDQDVYFVGADKNRMEILSKCKSVFEKNNITSKIILIKTENSYNGDIPFSDPISQTENINNILTSKVLLDVTDESYKSGFTLRPFEAAIYKKKLITNDSSIKKLKFYNKNNIFIINHDDNKCLKSFIETPYDDSIQNDLEYYEFHNWKKRFYL